MTEFGFERLRPPELSPDAQCFLGIGGVAGRLAMTDRSWCVHPDGRAESVAEHTLMLAKVAVVYAQEFYPDLDVGKVARYALLHDDVEAYVGDTPTLGIDDVGMADKKALEEAGTKQQKKEFDDLPIYLADIDDYEEQIKPEARFVKLMDKGMTILIHIPNKGEVLKGCFTKKDWQRMHAEKVQKLKQTFPEFMAVINVFEELFEYAIERTFKEDGIQEGHQTLLFNNL